MHSSGMGLTLLNCTGETSAVAWNERETNQMVGPFLLDSHVNLCKVIHAM